MNPLEQVVEGEHAVFRDDDLAVEHEVLRGRGAKRLDHFRKIPAERLSGLRLEQNLIAAPECQTAKAVPLGLVQPAVAARDLLHRLRLHRRKRRPHRQVDRRERLGRDFRRGRVRRVRFR
jgi:hypothetical protein